MATKKVTVEVSAEGLGAVLKLAERLNTSLDQAEKPRKIRAASAALSASDVQNTGLTRGTAAGKGRGDARDFGREAQGLGGLVHLYATFAANIYAVGAAFNALSKAADFTNMEKASQILSTKVGVSIKGIAKDMQAVTDGAISMTDALSSASLASSAGLNIKQIKELTTVAKGASIALGRDMTDALQRVFRGTIKIEPELLDELGLMVKVDDANKAYAKTLSKTVSTLTDYERRQAFVNAVTTQGINKYKELADQAANPFSKLLSSITNLGTSILGTVNIALGPFINLLSSSPTALLLGLGAIVSLLLKQAVPAIGNMRAAWEASDKAASESLNNQKSILEQRKLSINSTNKAVTDAALKEFVRTREALLQNTKGSSLGAYKEVKDATALSNFMGVSKEGIEARTREIEALLKRAEEKILQKLKDSSTKVKNISDVSSDEYAKAIKAQENLERARIGTSNLLGGLQGLALAATARATSEGTLLKTDKEITELTKRINKYEQLGRRVSAIRSAVQSTETLGFRAGFTDLFDTIKKGITTGEGPNAITTQFNSLEKAALTLRGTFSVLTTGIARVLGSFSIWVSIIAIAIPLLGSLSDSLGLSGEKADKLNSSTEALNTTLDTFISTQEKLKSGNNLADLFDLQAASATSLAQSLKDLTEQQRASENFRNSGEYLSMAKEGYQALTGTGKYDEDEELKTIKLYDSLVKKGLLKPINLNVKGGSAQLNEKTFKQLDGFAQTRYTNSARENISKIPKSEIKALEDYADASKATSQNLKELSDLSSEYTRGLVNQSKELKALNALSSSASGTLKQLNSSFGDGSADIGKFLNGITKEFETLSNTNLPRTLNSLRINLNSVDQNAETYRKHLLEQGKGTFQTQDSFEAEVEAKVSKFLTTERSRVIAASGGEGAIRADIGKYSLDAGKALANFSTATSDAALSQARIDRNLKKLNIFSALSGRYAAPITARAELDAERKKAEIEKKTIRSNAASVQSQLELQKKNLSALVDKAATATGSGKSNRGDATTAENLISLRDSAVDPFRDSLVSSVLALYSLEAQLKSLDNSIATINAGVTDIKAGNFKVDSAKLQTELEGALEKERALARIGTEGINARYATPTSLGVVGSTERQAFDQEVSDIEFALRNIATELEFIEGKDGKPGFLQLIEKALLIPKLEGPTIGMLNGAKKLNQERAVALKDNKAGYDIQSTTTNLAESTRQRDIQLSQLSATNSLLADQADLYSQIAAYTIDTTRDYDKVSQFNKLQLSSLSQQLSLQEGILATTRETEQAKFNAAGGNPEGQRAASLAILKAEQDFLNNKLQITEKITALFKEQNELTLKTLEQEGKWKQMFSGEGLTVALDIMADRIQETMNKTKSTMSQLATGLVDAADTVVDGLATMIQKMDETKLTFRDFETLLRNTLSNLFRDLASDALKNGVKDLISVGIAKAKNFMVPGSGDKVQTSQEKAAELTRLNTDNLATLNGTIQTLIGELRMGGVSNNGTALKMSTSLSPTHYEATQTKLDSDVNAEYAKLMNKNAKTDKEASGGFLAAAKDIGISSTMMQGAIGGLVGALVSGGSLKGAAVGVLGGVATGLITKGIGSMLGFANGGIMTANGSVPLNKYASGGIANSPQLAMFGEGRKAEAYVPLPDNRTIPVTLSGSAGGASMGDVNISISITNTDGKSSTSVDIEQSKNLSMALATKIKATVQEELIKQLKPRGMLNA